MILCGEEEFCLLIMEESAWQRGMLRSMESIAKSHSSKGKSGWAEVKELWEFGVFGGVCVRE